MLYANNSEFWNILEASDLTLLKIFIFHSSIEGLARRASTLFLKNGIMMCNMSQALFALTQTKPISSREYFVCINVFEFHRHSCQRENVERKRCRKRCRAQIATWIQGGRWARRLSLCPRSSQVQPQSFKLWVTQSFKFGVPQSAKVKLARCYNTQV